MDLRLAVEIVEELKRRLNDVVLSKEYIEALSHLLKIVKGLPREEEMEKS